MESPQQMTRDNTMETTAKEGIKFLEKNNPVLAEECKTVQESVKNGAGDASEVVKNGSSPAKLPRDNTMVTTAQEGKEFLEKQGGVNEEAKTRSQEAELNKSTNGEETAAVKRPAETEAEEAAEEPKKQKVEEEEKPEETEEKSDESEEKADVAEEKSEEEKNGEAKEESEVPAEE